MPEARSAATSRINEDELNETRARLVSELQPDVPKPA